MSGVDPLKFLRPDLADLEDYTPSKPLDVLAAEIGVPMEKIVKLDANESMYPVPQAVVDEMAKADLHIYSDPSQNALRAAIASYTGFPDDWIVAGNGGDDIIEITMKVVKPESIVVTSPTFSMYAFIAKIHQIKVVDVPRTLPHFDLDVDGVISAVRKGSKLVFLISPNNPTGNLLPEDELCRILAEDCVVAVDEAYVEFSPYTVAHLIHKYPNLVIIRTFSKWAGLAGLRIGYSISNPVVANWMNAVRLPFNVNVAGDVAAVAAIRHKEEIFRNVALIKNEVVELARRAKEAGFLRPLPSYTNFVLMEVSGWSAEKIADWLKKAGVFIRYYRSADLYNYLRISAGRPQDTERVFEEINNFVTYHNNELKSVDTIIFDMDGVLADVSLSYRSAIIETAASFGATVTAEEIVEAKNAGGANNDWILTLRLMNSKGVLDISLEQVIERFNGLYRGTPDKPGLYTTEKLLVSTQLLDHLSKNYKVGIVTGRPREECLQFLNMFDIGQYFHHLVCMEDAPAKPSPQPVELCLKSLGGTKAFMLGDTPDDMRAATGAGVYGLGIPAPGHGHNSSVLRSLYLSGAVKLLSNLNVEIPQILGFSLQ
eukprot:TRINITY_DN7094_c0_g1_i2.p1 TRINITY_DN7094_c0_g1~~TRINITY_DN7094_c0_g1_i2.p1  ORF type:complete len:599 (+),score=135.77 TRINITY_DN7094_c0_g1_i2:929-2725(+)